MFCIHCGKELDDGSKFCIHCGERLDEELAEAAADTAEEVKETVSEIVEEVKETAADTVEEVKETVSEKTEEAGETAAQTVDVVKAAAAETVEEVKETVSEKVEEVKETAAQTVDVVKAAAVETVSEKAEEAKETAAQTVDLVKASAEEKAEEVKETVAETAETAPETVAVEAAAAAKAIDVSALLKNKKVLIIAAAAVIVLILLIIIIAAAASAGSSTGAVALKGYYYTYNDAGETLVFYNGKQIKGTDLSSSAKIERISPDGSKAVLVDGKDALYLLSGDKITKITEDFDSSNINMSPDGGVVCYTFDDALFIYKGGKATKIADVENMPMAAAISPNGDTVVYAEVEDSKISTYAWKGGKLIDLDAKIIPYMVSNGGGIIYGVDKNAKLNYIKKLKKDSAESVKSFSNFVAYSYDCTQILFKSDNGVYYFDSSLKEAIKVSGSSIRIIFPGNNLGVMNDLKSFIAYSDGKVYSFKRKGQDFEKNSLVSSSTGRLSADGKTIVYLQGDSLYKTTVSNPDKKTLLAEEVDSFDADKSLKNIYFINNDGALRYADGKSKSGKKIIDDVNDFIVTPNGVCVFVDEDDELQYSANGGDRKKANLEDIEDLDCGYDGAVYVVSDGELYVSTDGKKFNKS